MPLDGHDYLVAQGWGGKGTGLREGAISRPIAVSQKKNLAGLGKDRDEAFPFWDHLFSAAAKSIVVKCLSDSEDEGGDSDTRANNEVTLQRTSTGILSTRRPIEGTPATSGTVTPDESAPRLSLMAHAKRDAARRNLYSRFFKGPIIGPEAIAAEEKRLASLVADAFAKQNPKTESVTITEHIEIKTGDEVMSVDLEVSKSRRKKSKRSEDSDSSAEDSDAKRERKRRRKERKEEKAAKKSEKKHKTSKHDGKKADSPVATEAGPSVEQESRPEEGSSREETKAERKARREEKRRLKALKSGVVAVTNESMISNEDSERREKPSTEKKDKKEKRTSGTDSKSKNQDTVLDGSNGEEKKRKKKRKRENEEGSS